MEKYKTMLDFGGVGFVPITESVVTAVPTFFPVTLFLLWVFGSASSYYSILTFTGKKRIWHSLTAMSFVMFLTALVLTGMNTATTTFISGYWVGFYILMTLVSWFMLSNYK